MKILGLCGSLRRDSWNRKLLRATLDAVGKQGPETEIFDLSKVPLFHPDVEARGIPPEADRLRNAISQADAVIIACPEYNNSMTSTLKIAIEWASRRGGVLKDKVFMVIGTSTGRSGAARMHIHASYALESEGAFVLHQPRVLLPFAANFMAENGNITDVGVRDLLDQAAARVIWAAEHLNESG